jgi:manganese transport protein
MTEYKQPHSMPIASQAPAVAAAASSVVREAPVRFGEMLRYLGPGLVLTASVVGTGEVIATPTLGATAGYAALWLVLLSCFVKLPLQLSLAQNAIATGRTPLAMLDELPGPRLGASWLVWLWGLLLVVVTCQQGAMLGGVAQAMNLAIPQVPPTAWAVLVAAVTLPLVRSGSYSLLERICTALVFAFTFATVACVGFLQHTEYAMSPRQLVDGLVPHLDASTATIALVVFAITGVGTTEIILYPYWCLQKGYARHAGRPDGSPAWYARARGWIRVMHVDALVSMAVYTVITLAFFLLGASVLHARGIQLEGMAMVATLSTMYTEVAGLWAFFFFLFGIMAALYSTLLVSTTANAELLVECLQLVRGRDRISDADRVQWRRRLATALPVVQLGLFLAIKLPVWLVIVGGTGQSIMLPIVAVAILALRRRHRDPALADVRGFDVALVTGAAVVLLITSYGFAVRWMG